MVSDSAQANTARSFASINFVFALKENSKFKKIQVNYFNTGHHF